MHDEFNRAGIQSGFPAVHTLRIPHFGCGLKLTSDFRSFPLALPAYDAQHRPVNGIHHLGRFRFRPTSGGWSSQATKVPGAHQDALPTHVALRRLCFSVLSVCVFMFIRVRERALAAAIQEHAIDIRLLSKSGLHGLLPKRNNASPSRGNSFLVLPKTHGCVVDLTALRLSAMHSRGPVVIFTSYPNIPNTSGCPFASCGQVDWLFDTRLLAQRRCCPHGTTWTLQNIDVLSSDKDLAILA